jgi:uncharacterized protein YciI
MRRFVWFAIVGMAALAAWLHPVPVGGADGEAEPGEVARRDPGGDAQPPTLRRYFLALLVKGPAWSPEVTPQAVEVQEGHMANIRRLADEGKLVLAGPFEDAGDLRGLFVIEAATLEEAIALCASDPAIRSGRLRAEVHAWWTAADLAALAPRPAEP